MLSSRWKATFLADLNVEQPATETAPVAEGVTT
jgi:hypothetical protein